MTKFQKRLTKILPKMQDCVVFGAAFGNLNEIIPLFNTIFILDKGNERTRAKNVVYLSQIKEVTIFARVNAMFLDLDCVVDLQYLPLLTTTCKPYILIEGNDVIGRDKSTLLYKHAYRAISQNTDFHIWTEIQ